MPSSTPRLFLSPRGLPSAHPRGPTYPAAHTSSPRPPEGFLANLKDLWRYLLSLHQHPRFRSCAPRLRRELATELEPGPRPYVHILNFPITPCFLLLLRLV